MVDDRDDEKNASGRLAGRPGAEGSDVRNFTHDDGSNSTVAGSAGKPSPHLYDPRIEKMLEDVTNYDLDEFWEECPECLKDACRKEEKATEGCRPLEQEDEDRLGRALAFEPSLRVRRFTYPERMEFALYDCDRCPFSGAHFRDLKERYEAAEVTE